MKVNKIIDLIIVFIIVTLSQLTIVNAQIKPSLTLVHNDEYDHLKLASLAFSPDGNLMITGLMDGIIWDLNTGEQLLRINSDNGVGQVAFSPDGSMVISGHVHLLKRIWDVKTGELLYVHEEPMDLNDPLIPISISAISFTPDGESVLYMDQNQFCKKWNYKEGKVEKITMITVYPSNTIHFFNDRDRILNTSHVISLSEKKVIHFFEAIDALPNDQNQIVSLTKDSVSTPKYKIVLWDSETYQKIDEISSYQSESKLHVLSPNGNFVMVGKSKNSDEETRIINTQTANVRQRFVNAQCEMEYVDKIVFSPNGKHVALVSGNVVNLYDISDLTAGARNAESLNP